ncbi:MAG: helix-turn-helix domain-containing protein [Acidimicrobiales bacterium]
MADKVTREILTTEQVAELLQVSTRTVLQLARDDHLLGQKVGRAWRFCRSDVIAFVRGSRRVKP